MNLWATREKTLHWLSNELKPESEILEEGFNYLAKYIKLFDKMGNREGESETGQFCRISSITLAKFSHLLLGCYSLTIDALAQESGALLRPLIETYELMVYFRQDKSRVSQMLDGKLPSAGIIGQKISGDYQDLRNHLNLNASHFGYKIDSARHLFDENLEGQPVPHHNMKVFRVNLHSLNFFQTSMLFEAVHCLFLAGIDTNILTDEIEKWRDTSIKIFSPKE